MLDILAGWLGWGREVAPPPSAPPQAQGGGIPVLAFGEAAAAASPLPPVVTVTPSLLRALGCADAEGWAPILAPHCLRAGLTTPLRLAMFLANAAHETGGLRRLEESLDYAAGALVPRFGANRISPAHAARCGRSADHPADQEAIANLVYGGAWGRQQLGNTEAGDGWRWRGRGLLQTTGRANYQRLAKATGRPLEDLPGWLRSRDGAAESACLFWVWTGCHPLADAGLLRQVRRTINGGENGMAEVQTLFGRAMTELGAGR